MPHTNYYCRHAGDHLDATEREYLVGLVDPLAINFVDLRNWVLASPDFDDDPGRCGEKILEAIQAAWIEELD